MREKECKVFHRMNGSESATLCGLSPVQTYKAGEMIACDCGHPKCQYPVNCPLCIEVSTMPEVNLVVSPMPNSVN